MSCAALLQVTSATRIIVSCVCVSVVHNVYTHPSVVRFFLLLAACISHENILILRVTNSQ